MKKRISLFLSVLLMLTALFSGCQSRSGQDALKQDSTQIQNEAADESIEVETQIEFAAQIETEIQTESEVQIESEEESASQDIALDENGSYTSKEEVAAYLHRYGKLPSNFITKKEAKKLGWVSSEGNLSEVAPGKSIGGDYFGNYEGLLPEEDDRDYYECDINSDGSYRGAERIVFSNDGLIYYTGDHYETFELLYGDE